MLDVHPPHAPTHTWKDFFIHLATITIGLLIAIGLEQTVEFFHHRQQRATLEQELRVESLRNLTIALENIQTVEDHLAPLTAEYGEWQHAAQQGRKPRSLDLPIDALNNRSARPAVSVWTIAQQNGTLELLPHPEAQRYVRVYSVGQMCSVEIDRVNTAFSAYLATRSPAILDSSTMVFGKAAQRHFDFSRLDQEQLRTYAQSLAALIGEQNQFILDNLFLYGVEWASWRGIKSDSEILSILFEARDAYANGGRAALLAKFPPPVEATEHKHSGEAN
jgi:hypothetical protein